MSTSILVVLLAITAFVALGIYKVSTRKSKHNALPIHIKGLGKIGYNQGAMDRTSAEEIARELLSVKNKMWPELLRIYHTGVSYPISTIILDPKWVDPKHGAGIKAEVGTGVVTLNPLAKWGADRQYDFRNAFAAELHSVIRWQMFGFYYHDKPVNKDDKICMLAATEIWKAI